jgi:hypothetical protein
MSRGYWEINISKNGEHYFATAPRSLVDEDKAKRVHLDLKSKYPETEGYNVEIMLWSQVAQKCEWETPSNGNYRTCVDTIINYLLNCGFEFESIPDARAQLRETCAGKPEDRTEPFSDKNYINWAARLKVEYNWTIDPEDLKAARENWLKPLSKS